MTLSYQPSGLCSDLALVPCVGLVRVLRFASVAGTCRAVPVGNTLAYHGRRETAQEVAQLLEGGASWEAMVASVGSDYIWVGEG